MASARPLRLARLLSCLAVGAFVAVTGAGSDVRLPAAAFPAEARLLQEGKADEALALLEGRSAEGLAGDVALAHGVLRAHLLARVGRYGEAADAWATVAAKDPALAPFAARQAVDSDVRGGRLDAAQARLDTLPGGAGEQSDLLLMLATAHRSREAWDEATALYDRVLAREQKSGFRDEALLGLAALFEQRGEQERAIAVLQRAQAEHHDSATYVRARAAERRLAGRGTAAPGAPPCDAALRLAVRLRQAARYREALELVEPCRADTAAPADREAADAEAVTILYLGRENDRARTEAAAFLERYPASLRSGDIRLTAFRLSVRMGQTAQARALGTALWREGAPGLTPSDRRSAARLLAAHLASIGSAAEGVALFVEIARPPAPRTERIDALWRGGVAAVRAGNTARARTLLQQARRLRPGPDTAAVVDYWLGVVELRDGSAAEGRRVLGSFAKDSPFSYYGMRALARLGRAAPPLAGGPGAPAFPALALTPAAQRHPHLRAASLLSMAGLAADASAVARRLAGAVRRDRASVLLAARAAADAGDYENAYRLSTNTFGSLLEQAASGVPSDLWALAYPRAYWSEVEEAATKAAVDPLLLLALARQESAFDPRARSAAGAMGLFQVMPYRAAELAPRAGLGTLEEGQAFEPHTNARLAAILVGDLLEQFDGEVAPVAASFNAGEDRAAVWWEAAKGHGEDLFVDLIPYTETRRYVRQVLVNHAIYKRLYAPGR